MDTNANDVPYHIQSLLPQESIRHFAKMLARYELYKKVIDLPGDIVEAGVFHGEGLICWAQLAQIFNPLSRRRVVGFDTFQGFPATSRSEHDKNAGRQANECNRPETNLSSEDLLAQVNTLGLDHRIELVPGDARLSIGEYRRRNPGFRVALLYLDFDTYDPTLAALQELYPLLVPGGVVVFDEYAVRGWGESDAVDEYFEGRGVTFQTLPWTGSPKAYLVKSPGSTPVVWRRSECA
jgi:SAM-dependent methyltransferase